MQDDEGPSRSSRPRKGELEGRSQARGSPDGAPPPRRPPARAPWRRPTGRRTARQVIGSAAENIAADFLRARGLEILERNYLRRLGELDIVAVDPGGVLVIAEVRARASDRFGGAAASVDFRKQQRLIRAAHQLLQQRPDLARLLVRFDVVCVSDVASDHPRVDWIRQAFLT